MSASPEDLHEPPRLHAGGAVQCPICGIYLNLPREHHHVRWTFEQGDPLAFARSALKTSPYLASVGGRPGQIPQSWWEENGQWVVDQVLLRFEASEGYVFGELSRLDLLARDIWKKFMSSQPGSDLLSAGA